MKKFIVLVFFLVLITISTFAQSPFNIHGGISIPLGDFSETENIENGYAKIGFVLGFTFDKPITDIGLSWHTCANLLYNPLESDDLVDDIFIEGADSKGGAWINIPILTGIRYQTDITETIALYMLGIVGVNICKEMNIRLEWHSEILDLNHNTVVAFGYAIGAGLVISKKVNFGIRYLGLGEPEIEYEWELNGRRMPEGKRKAKMFSILITLGYDF
ncbi:MAG: hypothetical protein KAX05_01800 [Bacteroidales bacterium]|nr:hypothetical protein [Bacteroidales bacterium]